MANADAEAVMEYLSVRYCRGGYGCFFNLQSGIRTPAPMYLIAEEVNTRTNARQQVWQCLACHYEEKA